MFVVFFETIVVKAPQACWINLACGLLLFGVAWFFILIILSLLGVGVCLMM